MYKKYLIVTLFLFYLPLLSQNKLPSLIQKGLDSAYNFEFEAAEKTFNRAVKEFPRKPDGFHYLAQIHLWYYLGSKNETDYENFLFYSDSALNRAEELPEKEAESASGLFMLGSIYMLKAVASTTRGEPLDAFLASKNAVNYFEETLAVNPKYYDAYFGLGVFEYGLSFVPGVFKWVLNLSGLSADKDKGLSLLRIANKNGNITKTESTFHLSKIFIEYLADYDSADVFLKKLIKQYPQNSLFHYQYGILQLEKRNLAEAEKAFEKVIAKNHPKFFQTTSFTYFLLGEIQFRRNDFSKAIEYYEDFINTTQLFDYTGISYLRLAECNKITEQEDEAMRLLLLARNGNHDIPDDLYAKRKSEFIYEKGWGEYFPEILQAENDVYTRKYKNIISNLGGIIDSIQSEETSGRAASLLSEAYYETKNYTKSLEYSTRALKSTYESEGWIYPFSAYLKAKSFLATNQSDSLKLYLDLAEKNNVYEFRSKINAQINFLKRKSKIHD